jgi:hypothetical protein
MALNCCTMVENLTQRFTYSMPDTNLLLDLALEVLQLTAIQRRICPASLPLTTGLQFRFPEAFGVSTAISSTLTFKPLYKI